MDDNITNNPIETHICNLLNQTKPEEEINALRTKVAASNELILEQLYVIKKSVEDIRNKHHQHTPDKSPANASSRKK